MAQLASLEFKDPGFVMRILKKLTLEMACMVIGGKPYIKCVFANKGS